MMAFRSGWHWPCCWLPLSPTCAISPSGSMTIREQSPWFDVCADPDPEGIEEGIWQTPLCVAQSAVERRLKRPMISVPWLLLRTRSIFGTAKAVSPLISFGQVTESAAPVGTGAAVELVEGITDGNPIPVPEGAGKRVDVGFREECLAPLPLMGRSPAW